MARRARPANLTSVLAALEQVHDPPEPPLPEGPLEWILWENVAYLVQDAQRAAAFRELGRRVGLDPEAIDGATDEELEQVAALGGPQAERRVEKLRTIAELALEHFGGDLDAVLDLPLAQGRRALMRFPGIGRPGADKILVACGAHEVLALESNGLRVLLRLGLAREGKSYDASYRAALAALEGEVADWDAPALMRAHVLLRQHGQVLCRNTRPACTACPLEARCAYAG